MVAVHALAALILQQDHSAAAERLRDADPGARIKARAELLGIGEPAVEPLCRILLDQYPEIEIRAETLVAELGAEDVAARERATEELIAVGARVESLLAERAKGLAGEPRLRLNRVLGIVKKNAAEEKVLSARQKESICMVLGVLRDKRAVEPLKQALAHEDFEVRSRAVLALGGIGDPAGAEAVAPLLVGEADFRMRAFAALALGQMGGDAAFAALRERLASGEEKNEQVQRRIMDGLTADASAEAAKLLIEQMESPTGTIRHAAYQHVWRRAGIAGTPFKAHLVDDAGNARTLAAFKAWWEKTYARAWE